MKLILICLLSINLFHLYSSGDNTYPAYESVVERFYKSHSFEQYSQRTYLRLEKRPTGWYTLFLKYDPELRILHTELFWDAQSKSYKNLDTTSNSSVKWREAPRLDPFLNHDFDKECYKLLPYYGYTGWDNDLIKAYENKEDLSDSLLLALAFAYSVYSSNLLNNNSGFADSKAQFKLSPGKNALSSQQLELYRKYRHKAQQTYKKLHKLKPNYLTSTGTIYNRLSNEYLISFLELRIYQNEQEAQKELISGLYSDFVITTAKNMLTSCDSNAILFTGGDADTYPLLYVQAFYRHRSDVCIVNLNLLNTDQYTNSFREKTLHAQPLPLSFSPSQLKAPSLQYTLLEDNHYKPSSLSKLIDYVADHGAHQPTQSSYHTNYFEIAHGMDTLRWTIEKPYLNKSEILLLDIINNNQWKRSLHFSALAGKRNYLGLHIYMQNNGLTYTLSVPNNALRNTGAHGYIDSQSLYKKLLSEYSWKGIKNAKDIESVYIPLYRYAFATLCQRLIIENKTKQAREVLNFCEELFPWEKVPVDYTALHFIENHYKLDQIAKGNEVAKTLLQHQQSLLDPEHTDAIRSYLRSFFSIYHQEDMLDLMDGR